MPPPPPPPTAVEEIEAVKFGSYASSERRRSITDTSPSDAWAGIPLVVSSALLLVLSCREGVVTSVTIIIVTG